MTPETIAKMRAAANQALADSLQPLIGDFVTVATVPYEITGIDHNSCRLRLDDKEYLVSGKRCSCPDWMYRQSEIPGGLCKHQRACLERGLIG